VARYQPNQPTSRHVGSELRVLATKDLLKAIRELESSGTLRS
jgi:hypothetical protein